FKRATVAMRIPCGTTAADVAEASGARSRLEVHEHVGDGVIGVHERVLHGVGDVVAGAHGDVALHDDVDVHQVAEPAFAHAAFFHGGDAGHGRGEGAHGWLDGGVGGAVHDFAEGDQGDLDAVAGDDGAGRERGPVVGGLVAFAADQ